MSRPRNKYSFHRIFSLSDRISAAHSHILPRLYPLRTRHPSPEIAPITLARISPTMNFRLPATYLEFTIIIWVCFSAAGGHLSPQCAVTGFLNFTFTYSGKRTFFILWPWTLAYDREIWTWSSQGHGEQPCQISRSEIISFEGCTHRHTRTTDCSNWPLTWSVARSPAVAEGPRDALSQLISCQLLLNCAKLVAFEKVRTRWMTLKVT